MEFPITRRQLQEYSSLDHAEESIKLSIYELVHEVCKRVQYLAKASYKIDKCVYPINESQYRVNGVNIFSRVIDTLKKRFPDCDITVDENMRYFVIDWS